MCISVLMFLILIFELGQYRIRERESGKTVEITVFSPNTKIVGGRSVNIKDFPYQISLLHNGQHICGGCIIGSNLILTAAHCTDGTKVNNLSVRAGSSIVNQGGQVIKVKRVHQNSKYSKETVDYDVSVLVLKKDISVIHASAIKIASKNTTYIPGDFANVTGWGYTRENGSFLPSTLQMVQVQIVDSKICNLSYNYGITNRMFCAGYMKGGKDSCQGDSGGPLVINNTLIGIVSWGNGCARPGYPGIYTKVSEVRDFIDANSSSRNKFSLIDIMFYLMILKSFMNVLE